MGKHSKSSKRTVSLGKYTDLEGWVLVIHYYTKRDPTNLALLEEMVKIFCSSLSPLKVLGLSPPPETKLSLLSLFVATVKGILKPFLDSRTVKLENLMQFPKFFKKFENTIWSVL